MTFNRYIANLIIRYAEAVYPEVRSKEFDESEHPRNEDGTFAVKGVDKSAASGIINFEGNKKALKSAVNSKIVSTKISPDQGYHIKGNPKYNERIAKNEHPSYLLIGKMEAQSLINEYWDKGKTYLNSGGFKVVFETDTDFAVWVDKSGTINKETNRGTIHIGQKGAHIVPAKPFKENK